MIGKTISHYKILEKLGAGGMGVVYKALDTRLDRFVALKFLPPHLSQDEEGKKRFIHEAKAASALDHPNICTIYEIHETEDGRMFIAMTYYEGETLKGKIERGSLSVTEAVAIATQVARGLGRAHEEGIVHRDIKPANIMITDRGQAKIVDFGLAKLASWTKLTKSDSILGTAAYMSPEQSQGKGVDLRTDIWSLGVVLYEMLKGEHPFKGDYEQAVVYSIMNEEPEPLEGVPEPVARLVFKALKKGTDERFQTADELLTHLLQAKRTGYSKRSSSFALTKAKTALFAGKQSVRLLTIILFAVGIFSLLLWRDRMVDQDEVPKSASQRLSIAVPYFDNNTGDPELDWLSEGILDMLITDLSQSKYLQVISRESLLGIMRNIGKQKSATMDRSFAVEIAQRAKAQIVVTGSIIKLGEIFRVLPQIYDLRSDRLIPSEKVQGIGLDIDLLDQLSAKIKVALEIEATGSSDIEQEIYRTKTSSIEAYKYYIIGSEKTHKGYYDEAISNLRKSIQIDSTFAHAYEALVYVYDILGEYSLAEEAIKKAIRFSSKLPRVEQLRILLREAKLRGDWDAEFEYLKQLVALQPDEADWHFRLGWYYAIHKPSLEQSVFEYEKAIEIDPEGQPRFYGYLGYTYQKWGMREEAISVLKKYVSLLPDDADSHDRLGEAFLLTGDYEKAQHEFKTALKLKPYYSPTIKNIGDLYFVQGMNDEALKYYKQYLAQAMGKGQEGAGHYYLGRYYLNNGQLDKAADQIDKVLGLDPRNWPVSKLEAYWVLGLVQIQKKNLDSANVILEKMEDTLRASRSSYHQEFLHHLKSKIYLQRNRFDLAIEELQRAIHLGPLDHAYFLDALAEAYFLKMDLEKAIKKYIKVFEFNPNYAHSHYMLGQVYEQQSKKIEAINEYEKFLEIWKNADSGIFLLEQAKEQLARLRGKLYPDE